MKQRKNVLGLCALSLTAWMATEAGAISGHVLSLDGDGDYMEVADSPALHSAQAFTLTAWYRIDEPQHSWQALFWKGDLPDGSPYSNREFGVYQRSLGYVHLTSTPVSRQKVGHLYLDTPGGAVKPGQWYHVAAVVNSVANYMKVFVNGEQMASRPYDMSGIRDSTGPLKLGGISNRGADFHGLLDEVRVWNRALSSGEIRLNMNRALTGEEPGLVAYYDFEQLDEQGLVPDLSGSGNRGRLQGDAQLRTIQVFMPPVTVAARARLQTLAVAVVSEPAGEESAEVTAGAQMPAEERATPVATQLVLPSTTTTTSTTTAPAADG